MASSLALAAGPHRLHPNAAAALGTPPRRELTLTPRLRIRTPPARCATPARLPRWGPRWPQALLALAAGPHRLHPNAAAALGTPPRPELTLTPRLRTRPPPAPVPTPAPPPCPGRRRPHV